LFSKKSEALSKSGSALDNDGLSDDALTFDKDFIFSRLDQIDPFNQERHFRMPCNCSFMVWV